MEGDLKKVDEVRNYLLKEVDSENYIALLPGEQWLISYWTGEFYDVLDSVNYYYTKENKNYHDKILLLHLNFMIAGEPLNTITQDEINEMADLFIEKHPAGKYTELVKNNIRYKFKASNWGFAFDFFAGYAIQNGELSSQFSNGFALGHGFDIEYKKFTLFYETI